MQRGTAIRPPVDAPARVRRSRAGELNEAVVGVGLAGAVSRKFRKAVTAQAARDRDVETDDLMWTKRSAEMLDRRPAAQRRA